jgi:hypothetical protein
MRKGLLGTIGSALIAAGSAFGQAPSYLPSAAEQPPSVAGVVNGMPVLLPASPDACSLPKADPGLTGGSTGLRPGIDCLPEPCDVCKKSPRLYGDIAYMLTWIKDGPQHFPLAFTTPPAFVGFGINRGTTLFGGNDIDYDSFDGLRGTVGVWLDRKATIGVEAAGFLTERRSDGFLLTNDGSANNPLALVRPVVDAGTGQIVTLAVAVPGATAGGVLVDSTSRLWGAEGNAVLNCRDCSPLRIDLLAGFRYVDLRETLHVTEGSSTIVPGSSLTVSDEFDCRNQFYGGQVGTRAAVTCGRLVVCLTSKLALGFTHEVVERQGSTFFLIPGFAPDPNGGGLLVQSSNAGRETRDRFAVVPETTLQLGYRFTEHLSAFIGYNFLYISSVVRPGDQVDPVVDLVVTPLGGLSIPGTSPGAVRPAGGVHGDSFYAHSLMVGMGYTW